MRALARWGVTPLLAAPLGAHALGFGDIELQSALNQPFQAQIALVATADELQGLKVNLAAPEVFERYGIEHPGFLARFEFRITSSGGRSVVQVTSREPVTEPFVTLLVEATWSRGRRLREYTVLLDPPVLLPAPNGAQAVAPAVTRPAAPNTSGGGAINRPAPPAESTAPAPRPAAPTPPRGEPAPASRPSETPKSMPTPRALPTSAPGGSYGPVRRAETLWAIADRLRPESVSVNQMMVAVYRANPHAFGGNMNVLLAGATLHLPGTDDFEQLSARVATAEVQRQSDEWVNRPPQERSLRLLPPSDTKVAPPAAAQAQPENRASANAPSSKPAPSANGPASASADENRRLLDVRNEQLRKLQEQAAAQAPPPAETPAAPPAGADKPAVPGVELEREQVFADEAAKQDNSAQAPAETAPVAPPPAPAPAPAAPPPAPGRSLISQALDWAMSPVLWIGLGVAALLLTALWFVRRRRQEPQDVTGRWEALESEVAEEARTDTERLRRQVPEGSIVVEEGDAPASRGDVEPIGPPEPRRAAAQRSARAAPPAADETLSSQTVINLDQADPVAEADFHMAYGLYDQAAELVQKALEAAPNRRDLKLKLLEVFFVWGNKDAFLSAAQSLRKEIGQKPDPDWDKVVIMGKQICPGERLFAEAASAGGHVDVDLQAGDSPLDLAFDEVGDAEAVDLDLGEASLANFDLEPTGEMPAPAAAPRAAPKARAKPKTEDLDSVLDIGERTAAGLESAFDELDAEDDGGATLPGVADSLAVTQESPTIETTSRESHDWAKVTIESPTAEYDAADAPTVETPTIESVRHDAPTMETPTVETSMRSEPPTVEQPAFGAGGGSDLTAEINLDDLGLDVKDLESLPHDLGDLPGAADRETDTREQPEVGGEDDLLSATGVTQVLHDEEGAEVEFDTRKTSVLADDEATMLAPSVRDSTMTGTEVLEHRLELDETGSTSLVRALRTKEKDSLDLNLDDLTQALHGGDTVEQPRTATFSRDVFGGGNTPVDIDIGVDFAGSDDPTGTEDLSPLDPQTMTEVGTKLDLARAYIDMGDPEGARSILEEVLDEGDPSQRREAQGLIDVLSA